MSFHRRHGRFEGGVEEFVAVCPLAAAVARLAGVHFNVVSPPAQSFWRWRGGICRRMPAGRCRSSLRRRAFLILFLRRHGRFESDGEEFVAVCPLVAAVLRLAGVHFERRFTAGGIVLKVAARNLSPCARWPLPFLASPACIFYSVSPSER